MSPDMQSEVMRGEMLSRIVCKRDTLFRAWRKIRENGQRSLSEATRDETKAFDADAARKLGQLQWRLSHKCFRFVPQTGIAKRRAGKTARPLVVAAIENRIVQRALLDVLQELPPIADVLAIPTSIGGIKDRGREHAMALVRSAINDGARFFIRSDIEGFFTKIPRDPILSFIHEHVADAGFIDLLRRATDTDLANLTDLGDDALLFPLADRGVAQGSPLSPLFGNILLRDFDRTLNGRGVTCIRYIDDFLLLGSTQGAVRKAFASAQRILSDLGLRAYDPDHDEKAEQGSITAGFNFLGCLVAPGLIQPARAARHSVLALVDEIIAEGLRAVVAAPGASPRRIPKQRYAQTLVRLDLVVRGWGHAFSFCDGRHCFNEIDRQIHVKLDAFMRRVHSCLTTRSPAEARRILGIHLLADTPLLPLPNPRGMISSENAPTELVKAAKSIPFAAGDRLIIPPPNEGLRRARAHQRL